ncbi:MAG: peptidylprolyl isomerase [Bacteroidota bacterium]
MGRIFSILLSLHLFFGVANAQTLLTYGNHKVDAKDFLRAYQRNNVDTVSSKEVSMRTYLDLYVNAKMKVREAYARRFDTLPGIAQEVDNLRGQLIDKYMADPVLLERLKKEAFQRSQTDREVAHLFISFRNSNRELDSARANRRKTEVEKKLQEGRDFSSLAKEFSDDPTALQNQGRIGFVTAFSLPYDMESAIYQTAIGRSSGWVRSNIGYHLFKVLSERPAIGKMKARQILLAIPPGADEAEKKRMERLADSLYQALRKGAHFGETARLYSNDNISTANGGEMMEFNVGQYDPVFENKVIALTKENEMAAPFQTPYGWHIVQRISITKPATDLNATETQQQLEQQVRSDDRWRNAKDFIYELVRTKSGARRTAYQEPALWQYSDSLLDLKTMTATGKTIQKGTVLFTIGKDLARKIYTAEDWIQFATNFRYQPDGSGLKPHAQVRNEWEQYVMVEYYKNNLESFNEDYKNQLTEFREGNLFFEIMQQEVWNKAQADTAGQRRLYNKQKEKYNWKASADVILFFCSDVNATKELHVKIMAQPSKWKSESLSYGERVFTDSARLEWEQIPSLGTQTPTAGQLLQPVINQADNNASFAYVLRVYTQPAPKSFEEARGSVITDLQTELEKNWEAALRKKYPVKVDQKVFAGLLK